MTTNDFFREDDTVGFGSFFNYPELRHLPYAMGGRKRVPHSAKYIDVRTEEKVQRNAPCPCGSGMKFKKCCKK